MTHMAALGLREAAQQVGLHRSSLFRAIRAGRLSAERTEGGDYLIDPAELFRVYPPRPERAQQSAQVCPEQGAQSAETDVTGLRVRIATLEGQVGTLSAELRTVRELADTLRKECDRWHEQAQRLALVAPKPTDAPVPRSWWPWRRTA